MMQKVLIVGGSTYDLVIHLNELPGAVPQTIHKAPFQEGPGSTGTGKAVPLTYLGVPNTLYTAFGNDWYGQQIENFLHAKKVNLFSISDPAGTQRHVNIMDKAGQRISMFITQSSDELPHDEMLVAQLIDDCDLVVLNIIPYCRPLIPLIKKSGKPVWTDLHDYDGVNTYHDPFIKAADYIQLSSDNLPEYFPVMEKLIAEGKKMVVCTHGKKGATLLASNGIRLDVPAVSGIEITDSNGAGDSFFAGHLYGYLKGADWKTCLQYAAIAGAWAVTDSELAYRKLNPSFLQEQWRTHFRDKNPGKLPC
jgi:sugar/nucleoside kinase (ribokinase family)